MSIRSRLSSALLGSMPIIVRGEVRPPLKAVTLDRPETPAYVDARTEAAATCRALGLDITNVHWDTASIADYVRLAYGQGFRACVSKVESPDTADAIAVAIEKPREIIDAPGGAFRTELVHQVAAVQRAAIYGVPK